MAIDFDTLEERDPRGAELATRAIAQLLRSQFIHVDDRGAAPLLDVMLRPEAGRLIRDYLDCAGYRLVVREAEGWAGILPDTARIASPRMRVDETLVLLLLARLWQEAVQEGDISERACVVLTANVAYTAYQELVARARRQAVPLPRFLEILRDLRRRAVVRLGDYDPEEQDHELTIRPIVTELAGDTFLEAIERFLAEAEDEDEPDEDEPDEDETGAGAAPPPDPGQDEPTPA